MNDRAEQAFRDAFEEHSRVHFDPIEPRTPRPWGRWLVAAAVAIIVLVVPGYLVLNRQSATPAGGETGGSGGDTAVPADPPSESPSQQPPSQDPTSDPPPATATLSGLPAPKEGWKWVSRYGVAVQVPDEWNFGHHPKSQWCVGASEEGVPNLPDEPFVVSPQWVSTAVACAEMDPKYEQMHLDWDVPRAPLDAVTEVVQRELGGVLVHVVLTDEPSDEERALADEILSTAVTAERDHAGCAPTAPFGGYGQRPEPWDLANADGVVEQPIEVGLCRYLPGWGDKTSMLVASRLLDAEEGSALLTKISQAPEGLHSDDSCLPEAYENDAFVIRVLDANGTHEVFVRLSGCKDIGFDDGTTQRQLTHEACQPLFARDPIIFDGGSSYAFERCYVPR